MEEASIWADRLTVYTYNDHIESHRLRFLLAEKEVPASIQYLGPKWPEQLKRLNPKLDVPFLTDKHLFLRFPAVIDEFIHERYPAPDLLPIDPVSRGMVRYLSAEIASWYPRLHGGLGEQVIELEEHFRENDSEFFIGPAMTTVDIALAPLLWRLAAYSPLPPALSRYAYRLFSRPSFRASLSSVEERYDPTLIVISNKGLA